MDDLLCLHAGRGHGLPIRPLIENLDNLSRLQGFDGVGDGAELAAAVLGDGQDRAAFEPILQRWRFLESEIFDFRFQIRGANVESRFRLGVVRPRRSRRSSWRSDRRAIWPGSAGTRRPVPPARRGERPTTIGLVRRKLPRRDQFGRERLGVLRLPVLRQRSVNRLDFVLGHQAALDQSGRELVDCPRHAQTLRKSARTPGSERCRYAGLVLTGVHRTGTGQRFPLSYSGRQINVSRR
jgi:hypothetical protein